MRSTLALLAVMLSSPAIAHAQNLLINGNLNALGTASNPNPALYYDVLTGWNISTTPQSFPQPSNPSPPIVRYPAYPASFADRLGSGNGFVFNSTEGNFPGFRDVPTVDADLTQSVPGMPGLTYQLTGYAYFEGGYAGGVDTIDAFSMYDVSSGQYATNSAVISVGRAAPLVNYALTEGVTRLRAKSLTKGITSPTKRRSHREC